MAGASTPRWAERQSTRKPWSRTSGRPEASATATSSPVFRRMGKPPPQKTGELVAVALVSGLPDVGDHGLIVDCLSRYLGVEAPSIPL